MANETNTTSLNDLIPSIIQEAMFVASERSIMRGLVKNYSVPMGSGLTVNVPIYGLQTAASVAEGTDLANTAVSSGTAQLVVSEAGIMTTITDLVANSASSNVVADVGRLFGEAIARKMDKDLLALFAGFSTVVGTNATELTAASIFKAVAKLRSAGVPGDALACVLSPEQAYDLKKALTGTYSNPNAGMVQNQAMQTGYVGMLAGVPVYETGNLDGVADVFKGGLFHRDALGLAVMNDIRIEPQRDASLRATELVATATYGVGELYDAYGVQMISLADLADA